MRTIHSRLAVLATMVFVALAVSQSSSPALVIASIATVVLIGALAVRAAALVVTSHELTVGARARAHKEALAETPEPRHPSTAGLPLTRAPSRVVFAA